MERTFKNIFLTFAIVTVIINFIAYSGVMFDQDSNETFGIYLTSYEKNNPSVVFLKFLPFSSLASLVIILLLFFRSSDIGRIQKINITSNTISKLKRKLNSIELQIQSCKKIEETGEMTKEEKKEWVNLAKEHKIITDEIRGLMITEHPKEDFQGTINDNKSSEEVWICTDCKEENPLTFKTCWKCLKNKNNPLK
jgi:hypothetical protein